MYRPLFRFWFCTYQSKSIFATLCNTTVSLYDPLMKRPVICCCWSLLCCIGAGRTVIAVEESLPVIFAKSLTETFSTRVEIDIVSWSFLVSLCEAPPPYSENLFPLAEITTHDMGLLETQTSWGWWQTPSSGGEKWEYLIASVTLPRILPLLRSSLDNYDPPIQTPYNNYWNFHQLHEN